MTPERIRRTLRRLAAEIIERNRGADNLVLLGIHERGAILADQLAAVLNEIAETDLAAHALDVTAYRDDRDRTGSVPPPELDVAVGDRDVILIDDVLFTGRTARAALDAIVRVGRPRSIQLVILVDRGHREYPIQPTYVGEVVPTKHKERVVVSSDDAFAVYIEE